MNWQQVPDWMQPLWAQWQGSYQNNRLPHAILLTGPIGSGKRELVEAFIRGAQCHAPSDTGLACERCPSCAQFTGYQNVAQSSHPDITWLTVTRYSIGIDEVREQIITRVLKTANYDRMKFLVIESAERMTVPAMNALLKNLEEPPPMTTFFLLSHRSGRLLPTIRSRCQRYVLPTATQEQGIDWLGRQGEGDPKDIERAMHAADGMPIRALQMQEAGQVEIRHQFEHDLGEVLARKQLETTFAQNWNPSATRNRKSAEQSEEISMDMRLTWMIRYGVERIHHLLAQGMAGREARRALQAYREILAVREYESALPAAQLNLEAACLALMKIPRPEN